MAHSIKIAPAIFTDHFAIKIGINYKEIQRGPGIWKMNVNTIRSTESKYAFQTFWVEWKEEEEFV